MTRSECREGHATRLDPRFSPGAAHEHLDEETEVSSTFERTVTGGQRQLTRTWPGLFATGAVGGIDVSIGLLGLMIVQRAPAVPSWPAWPTASAHRPDPGQQRTVHREPPGPIAAVAAHRSSVMALGRLSAGTLVTNLLGGRVMAGIMMTALPELRPTVIELGVHYQHLGIGGRPFALSLLGGVIITLMTWMERRTTSVPAKLVVAVSAAFLLPGRPRPMPLWSPRRCSPGCMPGPRWATGTGSV